MEDETKEKGRYKIRWRDFNVKGPKKRYPTHEKFLNACEKALKDIQDEGKTLTLSAICAKLGISSTSWNSTYATSAIYNPICEQVIQITEAAIMEKGFGKDCSPIMPVFVLKQKIYGFTDKHEVEVSSDKDLNDKLRAALENKDG